MWSSTPEAAAATGANDELFFRAFGIPLRGMECICTSKHRLCDKEQMSYVTNADAGCGLIRYGSALVPFVNRFPRNTKLYALMTTKPGEGVFGGEEVLV